MRRFAVVGAAAILLALVAGSIGVVRTFAWGGSAQPSAQNGFAGCIGNQNGGMYSSLIQATADTLGVTAQDVQNGIQGGKTIADQAKEKNVDTAKIVDAFKVKEQARLSGLVADGTLTQSQADNLLNMHVSGAQYMIDNDFNGGYGMMGRQGGFGGCGFNGGYGPGGDNDNDDTNWNGRGMMGGYGMMGYWN